jgi:hypothetical protein
MARVYLLNEAAGMLRPSPQERVDGVTRDVIPMAKNVHPIWSSN